jgi:hypothetical protein
MKTLLLILLSFFSILTINAEEKYIYTDEKEAEEWLYDDIITSYQLNIEHLEKEYQTSYWKEWYIKRLKHRKNVLKNIENKDIEHILQYIGKYDENFFLDVIVEGDAYQYYIEIKE